MSKPNLLDVFFASKFSNPAMGAMLMRKDWLTATTAETIVRRRQPFDAALVGTAIVGIARVGE